MELTEEQMHDLTYEIENVLTYFFKKQIKDCEGKFALEMFVKVDGDNCAYVNDLSILWEG